MNKRRRKPTHRHGRGKGKPSPKSKARETPPDPRFLPMTRREMDARNWDELDVLLITGDAYVDHPGFGVPLLGRVLEAEGYRVGIVAQPDWKDPESVKVMGRPRLFAGVSAGALDSMLAHYTAFRKKRSDDAYTPGGKSGARPNRACVVYTNLARQAFPGLPVVLGGIEASLRRAVHYDFWTDKLRRSILLDSKAEMLLFGMAEKGIVEVARRLQAGEDLDNIPGSAIISREIPEGAEILPTLSEMENEPRLLIEATRKLEDQVQHMAPILAQPEGKRAVIYSPPPLPLTTDELDAIYDLPFTRQGHNSYGEKIPAVDMLQHSMTAVRGCGGGCTFCSLALHQGKRISSRSVESLARELSRLAAMPHWRGTITDVGGPTANAWNTCCTGNPETCQRRSCYAPEVCPSLKVDQQGWLQMLRHLQAHEKVKHLRIASGLRHDLALTDRESAAAFVQEFVGGQLKLAPEHTVAKILQLMGKSNFSLFEDFCRLFDSASKDAGKEQYLVPYIISAFPGCTVADMKELARWFHRQGWKPQQVQCFIPTPGTMATAMYYAKCDQDGNPIHVAHTDAERLEQHAILME